MIDYLKSQGWKVETTVHFDTWEPTNLNPNKDKVDGVGTEVIDILIALGLFSLSFQILYFIFSSINRSSNDIRSCVLSDTGR